MRCGFESRHRDHFNASISQLEDHALLRRISRGSSEWKYHFLAVAVGSNPTWSKRRCHDRKAVRVVSTARFFKHPTTPFVLMVSTPPGKRGERLGSSPSKVKVGLMHVRLASGAVWQGARSSSRSPRRNIHIRPEL